MRKKIYQKKPYININIKNENNQQSKNKNVEPPPNDNPNITSVNNHMPQAYQPYYPLASSLWNNSEDAKQLEARGYRRPNNVEPPPIYEAPNADVPVGDEPIDDAEIQEELERERERERERDKKRLENERQIARLEQEQEERIRQRKEKEEIEKEELEREAGAPAARRPRGRPDITETERELARISTGREYLTPEEYRTISDDYRKKYELHTGRIYTNYEKKLYKKWLIDYFRS